MIIAHLSNFIKFNLQILQFRNVGENRLWDLIDDIAGESPKNENKITLKIEELRKICEVINFRKWPFYTFERSFLPLFISLVQE